MYSIIAQQYSPLKYHPYEYSRPNNMRQHIIHRT